MEKNELPLLMLWEKVCAWILHKTELFPKSARFGLASRLADATLDFLEHVLEAKYTKDRAPILGRASITLEKIRFLIRLSFEMRYLSEKQYLFISGMVDESGRMLGGWMKEPSH